MVQSEDKQKGFHMKCKLALGEKVGLSWQRVYLVDCRGFPIGGGPICIIDISPENSWLAKVLLNQEINIDHLKENIFRFDLEDHHRMAE